MSNLSRRQFLASSAALAATTGIPAFLIPSRPLLAAAATTIQAASRVIEVDGRPATVFGLVQPGGGPGLLTEAGQPFLVRLENRTREETLIHWHGLTPPWQQDGVPDLSQAALRPDGIYDYAFPLQRPGTNWMHSHLRLQEQLLMAAPLIVRDPAEAGDDVQEVVVMFHDFTFRDPEEILAELKGGGADPAMAGMDHLGGSAAAGGHQARGHGAAGAMDSGAMVQHRADRGTAEPGGAGHEAEGGRPAVHLNDVEYDAFLANDRTLHDPEVFRVERGGRVRLRLINAAAATNFWIDLGGLEGRLIATDGRPVEPLTGGRFEFAIAQRLDLLLELPRGEGAWPIFAVREGDRRRTGFVLATRRGALGRLPSEATDAAPPVGLALERRLRSADPLPSRQADRSHTATITEAPGYRWMINGAVHGAHEPLAVREGERVEITFVDRTTMAHPMHLHGHHFQVVAINGERFAGAMRDTVLVPARSSVTIAFDAVNPGKWALHCHHLYHMAGGMMTTVEYEV